MDTHRVPSGEFLQQVIRASEGHLEGNDLDFYRRVWNTDLDRYRSRLRAIQFVNMDQVLDAGAGFGQWTVCLSENNRQVEAFDYSAHRVNALQSIVEGLKIRNVNVSEQSIESLAYPDHSFDGVFCYGVIFLADVRSALRELVRVLKPGGKLYICANGPGWYFYNLVRPHNPSQDFNPRKMAIDALTNSLSLSVLQKHSQSKQVILPGRLLKWYLERNGFEHVKLSGEGTINLGREVNVVPFFQSKYYGIEGVYEVLSQKAIR